MLQKRKLDTRYILKSKVSSNQIFDMTTVAYLASTEDKIIVTSFLIPLLDIIGY